MMMMMMMMMIALFQVMDDYDGDDIGGYMIFLLK